jgi:hypothetical protein
MKHIYKWSLLLSLTFLITTSNSAQNNWAWVNGANISINQSPVFGTQGVGSTTNSPGCRQGSVTWTDNSGNLWLFGGYCNASGGYGYMSDLWKYTIASNEWTWVKGPNQGWQFGVYGSQGVAGSSNNPGARWQSCGWTDNNGNLWLFGGEGNDISQNTWLNDLWKYNIASNQWTWVLGSNTGNVLSNYGTQNVSSPFNVPGSRYGMSAWKDNSGNMWMWGGHGYDSNANFGKLNDLWRYNPLNNQWVWTKGTTLSNQASNFGTMGVTLSSNFPGGREQAVSWTDNNGDLWLFGGHISTSQSGNALWKYNIASGNWTWMKGTNLLDVMGSYGTQGVANTANSPGSRYAASSWKDANGNLWLFGGSGLATSPGQYFELNDLWQYNVTTNEWIWIKGANFNSQLGSYGTLAVPANGNTPGSRFEAINWTDASGNFWLYGGGGYTASNNGDLSDLWKFSFCSLPANPTNNTLPQNLSLCSGNTSTLGAVSGTATINWYNSSVGGAITGTGSSFVTPLLTASGSPTVYTYYAEAFTCISSTVRTAVSITVNPLPAVAVNSGSICQSQFFNMTPSGATSYTYSSGSSAVNPSSSTGYTVTGQNAFGCTSSAVSNVIVVPAPSLTFSASRYIICPGDASTINVVGATTYSWNTGDNGSIVVVNPTVTTSYTVFGMNTNGCNRNAVITITVDCIVAGFSSQSAFSENILIYPNPNNGEFIIDGSSETEIVILNIFGQIVLSQHLMEGKNKIELSEQANGIYFIQTNKGNYKIIKE